MLRQLGLECGSTVDVKKRLFQKLAISKQELKNSVAGTTPRNCDGSTSKLKSLNSHTKILTAPVLRFSRSLPHFDSCARSYFLLELLEMAEVEQKPPFPPFTRESALAKVKAAEAAWNTRNPDVVALAYTKDSEWRNRTEFFQGRDAIKEFLTRKWAQEHDYRLMKELWAFTDNHIAVRFEYEWRNEARQWFRTHGNELWEFEENGLMRRRDMSANDVPIQESQRRYLRPAAE